MLLSMESAIFACSSFTSKPMDLFNCILLSTLSEPPIRMDFMLAPARPIVDKARAVASVSFLISGIFTAISRRTSFALLSWPLVSRTAIPKSLKALR